eukprot:1984490-Amphidinium_carterae.1
MEQDIDGATRRTRTHDRCSPGPPNDHSNRGTSNIGQSRDTLGGAFGSRRHYTWRGPQQYFAGSLLCEVEDVGGRTSVDGGMLAKVPFSVLDKDRERLS